MNNVKFKRNIIIYFGLLAIFAFANNAFGQEAEQNLQVANFSVGKYGANNYEHFSFWAKDGKRGEISYSYKNRDKEIPLAYLGKTKDNKGFRVEFTNKNVFQVYVSGNRLRVVDEGTKKAKTFVWEYEGAVNGIGTACTICVESKDASTFVRKYFISK